ncbi:MAG: hypothetical protein JO307_17225 [Bryobacterales bacterium]|nr:hypothetical protein [Bryobacterales bacterium]MBV9396796.1 hypothetical protein [Bryobacterales bacterium]
MQRLGESVVWRGSKSSWLGPRLGPCCLISMVDEATGRSLARFVEENSTPANLHVLGLYLNAFGRPLVFRTHRLSLFRGNPRFTKAAVNTAAGRSQVRRALEELDIDWLPEDLRSREGFARDFFNAAKRELAPGLVQSGARTITEANRYLERVFLRAWHSRPEIRSSIRSCPNDAHRALLPEHDLEAILSEVEVRTVCPNGAIQFHGAAYRIPDYGPASVQVQIEKRGNGQVYMRGDNACVRLMECDPPQGRMPERKLKPVASKARSQRPVNPNWMRNFFNRPAPPLWRCLK